MASGRSQVGRTGVKTSFWFLQVVAFRSFRDACLKGAGDKSARRRCCGAAVSTSCGLGPRAGSGMWGGPERPAGTSKETPSYRPSLSPRRKQ